MLIDEKSEDHKCYYFLDNCTISNTSKSVSKYIYIALFLLKNVCALGCSQIVQFYIAPQDDAKASARMTTTEK